MKEVKEFIKNGDSYVTLWKDGVGYDFKVCDLVWENFVGKIPHGYKVSHIDKNKQNNRLDNLKLEKTYE